MARVTQIVLISLYLICEANAGNNFYEPGENLFVEGVPEISNSVVDEVGKYTEFRSAYLNAWHPTKREMVITTRFGETPQIHRVSSPGGARTQLTFFRDRVSSCFYQPKKGAYLIFTKDLDGNEHHQLYRYDLASRQITLLSDGKSMNAFQRWSNSGEQIVYSSLKRNGKDRDLFILNPLRPEQERSLGEFVGFWRALDWSPDDKKILVYNYVSNTESYIWSVDINTGERKCLTPKNRKENVYYGSAQYSVDGKGVYLTTDLDSEFVRLAYLDLQTQQLTYFTSHIPWDVEHIDLSGDGLTLAFITNEDGVSRLRMLSTKTRTEKLVRKVPVGSITKIQWHEARNELGFVITSSRHPSDVYSYELNNQVITRWTYSETGLINTENFPDAEIIRWNSFDGRTISGLKYTPPSKFTGRRPVIIDIHGGPNAQFVPMFLGRDNYFINDLGIVIIYPNIRGSTGYGKTFLNLDNGVLREGAYKDIGALLDWIKTQDNLDPNRILVQGASYGGHMALATSVLFGEKIRGVISVSGPSNLAKMLEHADVWVKDILRTEYGNERNPAVRNFFETFAPLKNVKKIRKELPFLIIQGANDPRVKMEESEQFVRAIHQIRMTDKVALNERSDNIWYILAKDEGHGFYKKQNRDYVFYASVLFVKRFLLN